MATIDELNKAVGYLEGKTDILIHNQDRLIETVAGLSAALKRRAWYDSAKVIGGAFTGGFTAVIMKLAIWGK
jgi:hypothetical protein